MKESWYLHYLAARTALLSVEIAAPFYVLYVREKLPVQTGTLGLIIVAAALLIAVLPSSFQNPYVYGSIFILLGFAEAGVLLGRKTFLIDQIDPAERTTYVGFANPAMGVVTLIFVFLGVLAQIVGIPTLIVILIVLGLTGATASYFLPETSKD